jgi:hypothetical protein
VISFVGGAGNPTTRDGSIDSPAMDLSIFGKVVLVDFAVNGHVIDLGAATSLSTAQRNSTTSFIRIVCYRY